MNFYKSLLLAGSAIILSACTTMGENEPVQTSAASFETIIAEAKAEYQKALDADFAWRDTKQLMEDAEKAQKAGDSDKAIKLALQAKHQATMALEQAARESNAGPRL